MFSVLPDHTCGTVHVGDDGAGVSLMAIGAAAVVHGAAFAARALGYAVANDNAFLDAVNDNYVKPASLEEHGTYDRADLKQIKKDFVVPCVSGAWHVASLVDDRQPAGLMLWHDALVGATSAHAGALIAALEDAADGDIYVNFLLDKPLDIAFINRYQWREQSEGVPADAAWSEQLDTAFSGDEWPSAQFLFVPPRTYVEQLLPWARAPAQSLLSAGVNMLPQGAGVVCRMRAEYSFARVWMHRGADGQRAGAKAILWFNYNLGECFAGHRLGDGVVPGPTPEERHQLRLIQEELDDPTWIEEEDEGDNDVDDSVEGVDEDDSTDLELAYERVDDEELAASAADAQQEAD